jgi:hypothetical protein
MPRDTPYAGVASLFRSALEAGRRPVVLEDGGQRRDFVHVADVARANVAVLTAAELRAIFRPFISGCVAGLCAFAIQRYFGPSSGAVVRLLLGAGVMFATYILVLLFALGQRDFYLDLFRGLRRSPATNGSR